MEAELGRLEYVFQQKGYSYRDISWALQVPQNGQGAKAVLIGGTKD